MIRLVPMRCLIAVLALSGLTSPALGQKPQDQYTPRSQDEHEYTACLSLAGSRPKEAQSAALAWRDKGGGHAALHCLAIAVLNLGEYEEGARLIGRVAEEMPADRPALKGDLFAQAANGWMIAGKDARAEQMLSAAIKYNPASADHRIDRAIARASQGKDWEALDDLQEALTLAPNRADALTFRASAWRRVGSLDLAAQDVASALRLKPEFPDALIERGLIRKARGDITGARADWQRVLEIAVEGPLTEAARKNLEAMDIRR